MATTLLEYFNELRDQNPFSWVKDSAITAVDSYVTCFRSFSEESNL